MSGLTSSPTDVTRASIKSNQPQRDTQVVYYEEFNMSQNKATERRYEKQESSRISSDTRRELHLPGTLDGNILTPH
jgi:hypothetical protein